MENLLVKFFPIIVVGVSLGSLFGLVGLGFTIIINATQLVNFGQGDFAMIGVAVCWFALTSLGFPLWLAFPFGVLAVAIVGFLTEKSIVTPLLEKGAQPFFPILGTMSIGIIAAGGIGILTKFYWMPIHHFVGRTALKMGGITADTQGIIIILATVALVIGYWFLLNKTLLGTALRATGYNRLVSILLGIRISRMVCLSFVISGVISGIAGILCAPLSTFNATDGLPLSVNGFIALIVGGWGNPYAAVLGGITLGLIRALLTGYLSPAHAELGTFFVLIIVLTFKPNGLFAGFMVPKTAKI